MVIWGESSHTDVLFFKSPVTASKWSFGVKVHTLTCVFFWCFLNPLWQQSNGHMGWKFTHWHRFFLFLFLNPLWQQADGHLGWKYTDWHFSNILSFTWVFTAACISSQVQSQACGPVGVLGVISTNTCTPVGASRSYFSRKGGRGGGGEVAVGGGVPTGYFNSQGPEPLKAVFIERCQCHCQLVISLPHTAPSTKTLLQYIIIQNWTSPTMSAVPSLINLYRNVGLQSTWWTSASWDTVVFHNLNVTKCICTLCLRCCTLYVSHSVTVSAFCGVWTSFNLCFMCC